MRVVGRMIPTDAFLLSVFIIHGVWSFVCSFVSLVLCMYCTCTSTRALLFGLGGGGYIEAIDQLVWICDCLFCFWRAAVVLRKLVSYCDIMKGVYKKSLIVS